MLYDSGAVSALALKAENPFRLAAKRFEAELKRKRSVVRLLSAVSFQELLVFGYHLGAPDKWRGELQRDYIIIELGEPIALEAARLYFKIPKEVHAKRSKKEQVTNRDIWHRDSSIMATAVVQQVDYLVTTDNGFNHWLPDFDGIKILADAG